MSPVRICFNIHLKTILRRDPSRLHPQHHPQQHHPQQVSPHHYISSLRVSAVRGGDMGGGALVARVSSFLRTQYRNSLANAPLEVPWCPGFK